MLYYLLMLLFPYFMFAKQSICLNMIVKDESAVIQRCLASVKNVIDYWVIIDTGSEDNTQEIIKTYLQDIPGELHESSWENFAHNRNEAFQLAKEKGDYILFMDADDVLEFEKDPVFPELTADLYNMWRGTVDFSYLKPQIVKAQLNWKWIGVTHEYLDCDQSYSSSLLSHVKYVSKDDGASHKDLKTKFLRNIELLTEGLKNEPDNVRYAFYLAESYRYIDEPARALEWFQKRILMGGWEEEIFWAKLQSALMLEKIGFESNVVIEALLNAYQYRPHRLEPIYFVAEILNEEGSYDQAYKYLKFISEIPKPKEKDSLFNMDWIEKYGITFQLSICAYYLGYYEESLQCCDDLLKIKELPENWRNQTILNREFPLLKLRNNQSLLGNEASID